MSRLIKCAGCGAVIMADKAVAYCDACRLAARQNSVVRDRTCKACGTVFPGGPRASFCPDCRRDRARESEKRYKTRSARGITRKIGSESICETCGKPYVVNSARQRYCRDCAGEAVRTVVAEHKKNLPHDVREAMKERKDALAQNRRVCTICGKTFHSDTPTVVCSVECDAVRLRRAYDVQNEKNYASASCHKPRHAPLAPKVCVYCGKEYTPTAPAQKFCSTLCYLHCVADQKKGVCRMKSPTPSQISDLYHEWAERFSDYMNDNPSLTIEDCIRSTWDEEQTAIEEGWKDPDNDFMFHTVFSSADQAVRAFSEI